MRIEHAHSPYAAAQVFDLVADVESYPKFLPWVIEARVLRRHDNTVWVTMTMGTRLLRRQFATEAKLDRPHRIDIVSRDPMFERFAQRWTFTAAGHGTDIEYRTDFRFRSGLLQVLIGGSFADRAPAMMQAFQQRARRLYG